MNIKNQNHCHKKRNSRQTTDHINNHSFCAFNKMQRSWDILFFCPLLFGSGLFLLTKIWMLLVLLFGYFMTCFAINLVYTSALGGVFYLVLGCGIKATWWDKLRSMWFSGYLLMTLISILSHYSFDIELFKFYYCRYADIYTSRVSNFLYYTPFMYFRSQEQVFRWVFFNHIKH